MPPCAELMVLGERMRAACDGDTDVGLDEAAWHSRRASPGCCTAARTDTRPRAPQTGRRAVESALWIDAHAESPIDLQALARLAA